MAFKLVSAGGVAIEAAVLNLPGSGVIKPNSVVIFDVSSNAVSVAATTTATGTNIIGVSLDYIQGKNEPTSFVRVIPFVPGQVWEADALNVINTAQLMNRFRLYDSVTVENTSYDQSLSITGVFHCLGISGASSGSAKVLGTFLKLNRASTNSTNLYN